MTDANILLPYPCKVEYNSLSGSLFVLCARLTLSRHNAARPDQSILQAGDNNEL